MQTDDKPQSIRARICPEIELKLAATRTERLGAFELVYRSYLRAGLCTENCHGFRVTSHGLLPTTDIIIARLRGEVISTLSLVRDGALGLPMEEIYPKEVARRRAAGSRLAEVSCLADRRRDPQRFFELFCDMGRLMAQLARKQSVDELLVAVHPRHASLYRRFMAFKRIGSLRVYPTVRDRPAVALALNFRAAKIHNPAIWQRFFGKPLPDSVLRPSPIPSDERDYFRLFLEDDRRTESFGVRSANRSCGGAEREVL